MWDFLSKAGNSILDGVSNVGSAVGDGLSTVGEYAGAGLSHVAERMQDPEFQEQARLFSAVMSDDSVRYQNALNAYDKRKQEIARQKREDMQRAEDRKWKLDDLKQGRKWSVEDRDSGYNHELGKMDIQHQNAVALAGVNHGYNIASQNNAHSNSKDLATHNNSLKDKPTEWRGSVDENGNPVQVLVYSDSGTRVEGAEVLPVYQKEGKGPSVTEQKAAEAKKVDEASYHNMLTNLDEVAVLLQKGGATGPYDNARATAYQYTGIGTDAAKHSAATKQAINRVKKDLMTQIKHLFGPQMSEKDIIEMYRFDDLDESKDEAHNQKALSYIRQRIELDAKAKGFDNPSSSDSQAPNQTKNPQSGKYPDGTPLKGKDGKRYIVQGGVPVLQG